MLFTEPAGRKTETETEPLEHGVIWKFCGVFGVSVTSALSFPQSLFSHFVLFGVVELCRPIRAPSCAG